MSRRLHQASDRGRIDTFERDRGAVGGGRSLPPEAAADQPTGRWFGA